MDANKNNRVKLRQELGTISFSLSVEYDDLPTINRRHEKEKRKLKKERSSLRDHNALLSFFFNTVYFDFFKARLRFLPLTQ